jgi:hypothetical protein
MPIEAATLADAPIPLRSCPKCGKEPFEPFMRGQVQRSRYRWLRRRPYCALICSRCKLIIDWEYGRAALDPV